jgi:hypothetical protein
MQIVFSFFPLHIIILAYRLSRKPPLFIALLPQADAHKLVTLFTGEVVFFRYRFARCHLVPNR